MRSVLGQYLGLFDCATQGRPVKINLREKSGTIRSNWSFPVEPRSFSWGFEPIASPDGFRESFRYYAGRSGQLSQSKTWGIRGFDCFFCIWFRVPFLVLRSDFQMFQNGTWSIISERRIWWREGARNWRDLTGIRCSRLIWHPILVFSQGIGGKRNISSKAKK